MLALITLLVVNAFTLSSSNLKAVGNMQAREETMAAANQALTELGHEPWPILEHPAPEWLAGKLTNSLTRFRHAMLRRRSQRRLGLTAEDQQP